MLREFGGCIPHDAPRVFLLGLLLWLHGDDGVWWHFVDAAEQVAAARKQRARELDELGVETRRFGR